MRPGEILFHSDGFLHCPGCRCPESSPPPQKDKLFREQKRLYPTYEEEQELERLKKLYGVGPR